VDDTSNNLSTTLHKLVTEHVQNENDLLDKQNEQLGMILDLKEKNMLQHVTISEFIANNDPDSENNKIAEEAKRQLKRFYNLRKQHVNQSRMSQSLKDLVKESNTHKFDSLNESTEEVI
jgi:hypothetical protein